MPSYDLVCQECGHKFSVFCSISQKEKQTCPACGSGKVGTRFTAVNIGGGKSSGGSSSGSGSHSFG